MTKSQELLYSIIKSAGTIEDKTKLAKLQYFSDFLHFAFNNTPISQEDIVYTREKQGPLARNFNQDLSELKKLGYISEFKPFRYKIIKDKKVNFNKKELYTINYVINKYGKLNYSDLVRICHCQIPYLSTSESGIVEFFTAYNLIEDYPDYASSN